MAWNDVQLEQMVSYVDASTSPFALISGQSHGTTNQCMDKTSILGKYVLNSTKMAGYVNNQLVPKKEWETPYSFTFYLYGCEGTIPITGYAATTTFSVGTVLYRDANLSLPIYFDWLGTGVEETIYGYDGNEYQVNSTGAILSITPCVTNSVSFTSWYSRTITDGSDGTNGLVTITGAPVTFYAQAIVTQTGGDTTTQIAINGTNRVAIRTTVGTTNSTTFTLPPGTYPYSLSVSVTGNTGIGAIVWTQ